jgi:leucyl aminopeptidase (aminopeptidase T)
MDPVVVMAGTALVGAIVTDAYQHVRGAAAALWRRGDPEQAAAVERDLDETRARVLAARADGDRETEEAIVGGWRLRLQDLVRQDPAAAQELQRVLDEELLPVLDAADRDRARSVNLRATASGNARVYQAGRDIRGAGGR